LKCSPSRIQRPVREEGHQDFPTAEEKCMLNQCEILLQEHARFNGCRAHHARMVGSWARHVRGKAACCCKRLVSIGRFPNEGLA
jgi:hypothetical protein